MILNDLVAVAGLEIRILRGAKAAKRQFRVQTSVICELRSPK
jgi:hypothetical protein